MTQRHSPWRIEGHAIISDNDCIADAAGHVPQSLRNDADWAYFQRHLDEAALVVTGRKGHEAHPNKPGRRRLVFTTTARNSGFAIGDDISFLDPARFGFHEAVQLLAPVGGIIAITGGTAVFDWFAQRRLFTAFHLGRAMGVTIRSGRRMFSDANPAEEQLFTLGLTQQKTQVLDELNGVSMTVFSVPDPSAKEV